MQTQVSRPDRWVELLRHAALHETARAQRKVWEGMKTKQELDALAEEVRNRRAALNLARRMCDSNSREYRDALAAYTKAKRAYDAEMEKIVV